MPVRSLPLAAAAALFALAAAAQTPPAAPGQPALGAAHKQPTRQEIEKRRSADPGDMATPEAPPAAVRTQSETDRLYQDIMRRSDPNQ
jgi:hypothetical protein